MGNHRSGRKASPGNDDIYSPKTLESQSATDYYQEKKGNLFCRAEHAYFESGVLGSSHDIELGKRLFQLFTDVKEVFCHSVMSKIKYRSILIGVDCNDG
ncbi:MAG: hypothetical protein Ct9H300mP28_02730 [Pseudomonadota bacterium]|nr:MAG: hypothetical protein Ct9H300mP28_02730 [Pseudomonadota bacterium]